MNAEGLLRPRRNVAIEIIRRVGEGREQQDLSIVRVDRRADLVGDDPFESRQLRVTIRRHKASGGQQRAETITVLGKILPPTNAINVLQQHLDLAANEQRFEGGIIDIDIVDGRFLNGIVMGVDLGEQGLDVSELALDGQRERSDRAFHPLQDIHAQQVNEAFLAVYLALGTVMESFAIMVITVPVFAPIVGDLGYSMIWWGLLTVCCVETGMISPPFGLNLFVLKSVAPDTPLTTIYRGVLPFCVADFVRLAILVAFPGLVLWLPQTM